MAFISIGRSVTDEYKGRSTTRAAARYHEAQAEANFKIADAFMWNGNRHVEKANKYRDRQDRQMRSRELEVQDEADRLNGSTSKKTDKHTRSRAKSKTNTQQRKTQQRATKKSNGQRSRTAA